MESQILINEVHPNPDSGSEWIELLLITEETNENFNLTNFTIFDSARQIYKFSNEQFIDQILVIEVSGLNNDTDSVVLKDELGTVMDSFTYNQSEKGLSWSRENNANIFILTAPSQNIKNPYITPTPTLTPTTITLTPTLTPTPTISLIPSNTPTNITPQKKNQEFIKNEIKQIFRSYDLAKIKLNIEDKEIIKKESRLVFISKEMEQAEIINAIIGSFLLILGACFLIYAKIKNKRHDKLLACLFIACALGWNNFFLI